MPIWCGILSHWTCEVRRFENGEEGVKVLAFTLDGQSVFAGSRSTLRLWDLNTGAVLRSFTSPDREWIEAVAVTPNGQVIAGYGLAWRSGALRVWDIRTGTELRNLEGHTGDITAVIAFQNGGYAVSLFQRPDSPLVGVGERRGKSKI